MHCNKFYTETICAFRKNTYTLNFYTKYGWKKTLKVTLSLKGNDKAISILQNVIKVMVVQITIINIVKSHILKINK